MAFNKKTPKKLRASSDPDAGLEIKESFIRELARRVAQKNRTFVTHEEVLKKYGRSHMGR